jgi:hypothetical protein
MLTIYSESVPLRSVLSPRNIQLDHDHLAMNHNLIRKTKSGALEFLSTRVGKIATIEFLILTEFSVWASLLTIGSLTSEDKALLGLGLPAILLLTSLTLVWAEYRFLTGYAVLSLIPIGILVHIKLMIHYVQNGMSASTEVTAAYTGGMLLGGFLCFVSAVLAGLLRFLLIKKGLIGNDETPEEAVLGDKFDQFEGL